MNRSVTAAAAAAALALGLTACNGTQASPQDPTTTTSRSGSWVDVGQHETFSGSPVALGLVVPDGATEVGALVRRRSPQMLTAYADVVAEAERRARIEDEIEQAQDPEPPTETATEPVNPLPTEDSFAILEEPPEPDTTTALLRVDGDPGEVFSEVLATIADELDGLELDPDRWSQFCTAADGVYTGCRINVTGRNSDDLGVRYTVTLDPGAAGSEFAPAGSQGRPVMTLTARATDPPDVQAAWDALEADTEVPGESEPPQLTPTTPAPTETAPLPERPEVEGTWEDRPVSKPVPADATIVTDGWQLREDTALLLSGDAPAFASLLVERGADADAIARGYVLAYSDAGEPKRDVIEDRTEISTTYRAVTKKGSPQVSATFTQSGRGNYVALFYTPAG
ncbi:hypothetical protein CLV56_2557 [Mumia flava]|uniref:Uncharacterized protein n=1 Tax=Mumia flava TaxID=1348852 RepID=A0A0B2BN73_9ACTN|nr:hypothetical protein [Mumia flava]PJJ58306.1 hypothetical protein CLV56_2557 [Mumia flava]